MRWLPRWRTSPPRPAPAALSLSSADRSVTPHRRSCCNEDAARRNLVCPFLPPTPHRWRTGAGFSTGGPLGPCRWFGQSARRGEPLSREWLAQLWVEDKRGRTGLYGKRKKRVAVHVGEGEVEEASGWRSWASSFRRSLLSGAAPVRHVEKEAVYGQPRPPPAGQHGGGALLPRTPEEVKLAPLLARANLVITRDIEWANIMFAFEQESRYIIMDASDPRSPVGFVREQSNVIYRQLLRSRRPFTAYIIDAWGNEIFRVRRPFWWINSTIYAEVDGKEIGVVHRRWHLWRRIYDLYLGTKQFAVVENPGFWNWTFTLKNDNDNVLAEITRDWRGIGLELFTDAGQYVIRFGLTNSHAKPGAYTNIEELDISRPLTLSERAVAVALAVSLDCDYFSRSGGWGLPFVVAGE